MQTFRKLGSLGWGLCHRCYLCQIILPTSFSWLFIASLYGRYCSLHVEPAATREQREEPVQGCNRPQGRVRSSCWIVLTSNRIFLLCHVFGMLPHVALKAVPRSDGLPIRGLFIVRGEQPHSSSLTRIFTHLSRRVQHLVFHSLWGPPLVPPCA